MKNKILLIICIFFVLLNKNNAYAQFVQDINGRPFNANKYADVTGSPFLFDKWMEGIVKLQGGDTYKNIPLRYDAISNELYFKSKKGDTLTFVEPVVEFQLLGEAGGAKTTYRRGYANIGKYTIDTFYEVLTDGTAQLLKRTSKYIVKNKPYNSATETQTVNEDISYYIFADSKMTLIKKDKKYVLPALNNKQTELDAFIKSNNLNLKNDDDLTKLVVYYNSL